MKISKIHGRHDAAAYTFVLVAGLTEFEATITAPDEKTARAEFCQSVPEHLKDSAESVELVEVERFDY